MKQSNFILSFLIPEKHAHGSDMNVFIEPLMDDMVDMFDEGSPVESAPNVMMTPTCF
jgi:hypothetical protein